MIENHDKLFIDNILGVPCNTRGNASKMRWIDNFAHRIDGGTVHVKAFRFGGEGAGLPALVNYAPYACLEVLSKPDLETEMCGRLNRSGPISPEAPVRGSGGSSIVIEGSVFASHAAADIVLEEVPSLLVLRGEQRQTQTAVDRARLTLPTQTIGTTTRRLTAWTSTAASQAAIRATSSSRLPQSSTCPDPTWTSRQGAGYAPVRSSASRRRGTPPTRPLRRSLMLSPRPSSTCRLSCSRTRRVESRGCGRPLPGFGAPAAWSGTEPRGAT